jgi:hypothetical protein
MQTLRDNYFEAYRSIKLTARMHARSAAKLAA